MAIGILKHVKKFDLLAQPVTFEFEGSSRMKTVFGAVMTSLYMIVLLGFGIYSIIELNNKSSPSVLQLQVDTGMYERIDFEPGNNLLPVLYVFNQEVDILNATEISKYVTPVYSKKKFKISSDSTGKGRSSQESIRMAMVPCSQLMADEEKYKYYKHHEHQAAFKDLASNGYALCADPNPDEIYVAGGGNDPTIEFLVLEIYPCSLESGCASQEEINKISIVVGEPTYSVDYSKYDSPISKGLNKDDFTYINTQNWHKSSYYVSQNQLIDNQGDFYRRLRTFTYVSMSNGNQNIRYRHLNQTMCNDSDIRADLCDAYLSFEFKASSKKLISNRTYRSLTVILSEFGGFSSLAYFLFYNITAAYLICNKRKLVSESLTKSLSNDTPATPQQNNRHDEADRRPHANMTPQLEHIIRECLDLTTLIKDMRQIKAILKDSSLQSSTHTQTVSPYRSRHADIRSQIDEHTPPMPSNSRLTDGRLPGGTDRPSPGNDWRVSLGKVMPSPVAGKLKDRTSLLKRIDVSGSVAKLKMENCGFDDIDNKDRPDIDNEDRPEMDYFSDNPNLLDVDGLWINKVTDRFLHRTSQNMTSENQISVSPAKLSKDS